MSDVIVKSVNDLVKCEEIDCDGYLGYFDVKNGRRFCKKCRNFLKVLRWKCKGCDTILYGSQCRETKKYCDRCKGLSVEF